MKRWNTKSQMEKHGARCAWVLVEKHPFSLLIWRITMGYRSIKGRHILIVNKYSPEILHGIRNINHGTNTVAVKETASHGCTLHMKNGSEGHMKKIGQ